MLPHLGQTLHPRVPITLILGQRSWMKAVTDGRCVGEAISDLRPRSYVAVHQVVGAGHHVHADQPGVFNDLVNLTCSLADCGGDTVRPTTSSGGGERQESNSAQPTGSADLQ